MVRPLGEEVVIAWFGPCVNHFARIDETVEKTHNLRKTDLCTHKADQVVSSKADITRLSRKLTFADTFAHVHTQAPNIDQGIKESPLWRCGSEVVFGFNLPMCSLNFFLCTAYGFNFSKGARKDGGHAAARGNEAKREKDSGQLGPMGARRAPKLRAEPPAHPPPPHLLSKKTKGGASSGPPQIVPPRMRLMKAVLRCAALSVF